MITMGVQLFGCEPFLEGQRECDCLKGKSLDDAVMNTLRELYDRLPEKSRKTEEELIKLREKYRKKEYKLIDKLLNKYPKQLIEMVEMGGDRMEL